MLLVDANVLLYAANASARQHPAARLWLTNALAQREPVGFAWTVLLAFLRLATHAGVFPRPLTPGQAADLLEQWLGSSASVVVEPTARHLALLRGLLSDAGTAGNLVGDAHLAALALEYDAQIVSFDRDFGRFSGVRQIVPGSSS